MQVKASEPVFPIRQLLSTDNDMEVLTTVREQIHERPGTTAFAGKSGVWIAGPDELTLEIITEELRKRLPSKMTLGRPTIDYRETISRTIEIEGKEIPTGRVDGRFWYGHVWLKLEPAEKETKITFVDAIRGGTVPTEFIPAVEAGIRNALLEGPVSGFPVAGIRATLFDGSYHDIDSSEEAFFKAAFTACKKGLQKAEPVIFEPIMFVEVRMPEFCVGNVIGDLSGRRGLIVGQDEIGGISVIRARVPMSEMFGYPSELRTISQAAASFSMKFDHFARVPPGKGPDDDEPKSMVMRAA
jgi:elongation factor G